MARIRSIKPEIRTSEKVNSWPVEIRYFWIMLWGYVDDYGKGRDNTKLIVADTYPLDDDVTPEIIESWLTVLARDGVIRRYEVDGKRYLLVLNWSEHQKPSHPGKSVIPDPLTPSDPSNRADSGNPPEGLPRVTVNGSPEQRAESREQRAGEQRAAHEPGRTGTRIPSNFTTTPPMIAWALENTPNVNWQSSTQKFKSHYRSVSGKTQFKTDWGEAWKAWLIGDQERAMSKPQQFTTPAERKLAQADQLVAHYAAQEGYDLTGQKELTP